MRKNNLSYPGITFCVLEIHQMKQYGLGMGDTEHPCAPLASRLVGRVLLAALYLGVRHSCEVLDKMWERNGEN